MALNKAREGFNYFIDEFPGIAETMIREGTLIFTGSPNDLPGTDEQQLTITE